MDFDEPLYKITEILKSLGLSKNEIIVYIDLVRYNLSTALDISKRTKIHRSNTYDALRKLTERGFISEIILEKKKLFKAMPIEKIRSYILQKAHDLESLAPLPSLFSSADANERISTSSGVFSAREAMTDLLSLNSTIKAFGAPKEIIEVLGLGFLKDFHIQRIKKKILMRHIYNDDAMDRIKVLNKMKYTDAYALEKQYSSSIVTLICKDTVLFFVLSNPITTIKLRDAAIADSFSRHFDALLAKARKPSDKK